MTLNRTWLAVVAVAVAAAVFLPGAASTATQPDAPLGTTAIALAAQVQIAWAPVAGASSYSVYRGTTPGAINTRVSPAGGVTGTSFTDGTVANGSTYDYAVRAVADGVESVNSVVMEAKPRPRSCSAGNAVVVENCFAGDTGWRVTSPGSVATGGIEGFATATSVNRGGSFDIKVKAVAGVTYHAEIYRSGYYGGAGGRLISTLRDLPGIAQPLCVKDNNTGLIDCSNWTTSATITTTSSWPTGVYTIRLVRDDTGSDNEILFVVRDDSSASALVYGVDFATYQAYNNYGGKSLYDTNSFGGTTVAGTARAVKVSYDRPFEQPRSGQRDWYSRVEFPTVYWLEREGFDVSYQSNTDLERNGSRVTTHRAYISGGHDEYYSAGMRSALEHARDAGTNLFFTGSNEIYWKIRFEDSPVAGGLDRVQVCYKSTQSGGPDPSGTPTGTWRDPAGANKPENALTGEMYVGDNDNTFFPLVVSATEGSDRIWRYTGLDAQIPGTSTSVGHNLVGWEWDARTANGYEPAGVKTLASSPVTGNLIQNYGQFGIPGSTTTNMVKYTAGSGALVVTTGTNHWSRGLALNADSVGEPEVRIQQATTNILADMGANPQSPSNDIVLDAPPAGRPPAPANLVSTGVGTDSVSLSWNPVAGAEAYNVYRATTPRSGGQPLGLRANGGLVTGTTFTDVGLLSTANYYYVVTAVVAGVQSPASVEVKATTSSGPGEAIRIDMNGTDPYTSTTGVVWRPDDFFTGGNLKTVTSPISGTTDPALYQTERWGQFSYAIPVANGTYDLRFHFAETYYGTSQPGGVGKRIFGMDVLDTPTSPDLANIDIYSEVGPNAALVKTVNNVLVTDGFLDIASVYGPADDPTLAALEIIPKGSPPTVSLTIPSAGAVGISPFVSPRATFSRAMKASTITSSSFTLRNAVGSLVPATVSYDTASRTAILAPSATLALSTKYTARLATSITADDGVALPAIVTWTFTTAATPPDPPTVTNQTPAQGATGIASSAFVEATFSRAMAASTINATSFTLTGPTGPVDAVVTYDATTRVAHLEPSDDLAYQTTYTARLAQTILAADDTALGTPVSWTFTTRQAPPPPTLVSTSPLDGTASVARDTTVKVRFSRDMNASTITGATFTLRDSSGLMTPASISYDPTTFEATLIPSQQLASNELYTARIDASVKASDGAPLGTAATWLFSTSACPCSLFPVVLVPASQNNPTQDGRFGTGPWSYELGVKVKVDQPLLMTAMRFYKSSRETGTHTGSIWTSTGVKLATVLFTNESASGWQRQTLSAPFTLQPGAVYVLSVNANAYFGLTSFGLQSSVIGGPMRTVADGANGVFGLTAGDFPTRTSKTSNYFVDAETVPTGETGPPTVASTAPGAGEAGVARTSTVAATFSRPVDPATVGNASFSLRDAGGNLVPATVSYEDATNTARLTPSNPLLYSTTYTAKLTTGIRARDGLPLSSPTTWSFTIAPAVPPQVVLTVPVGGAADVGPGVTPRAQFSKPIKDTTLTASTFTLTGPSGPVDATVAYDAATKTATLTPSALLPSGAYTARLDGSIQATDDALLTTSYSWVFTVGSAALPFTVATRTPSANATEVARAGTISAAFNRSADPLTVTSSNVQLVAPDGSNVAGTITYDDTTKTVSFKPSALLSPTAVYTMRITTGVHAADGVVLDQLTSWSFTTTLCPCSLFPPTLAPVSKGNPTQDGRVGAGPWSYELGVKIRVTTASSLIAIRYYRDTKETGSHAASIWSATGTKLATIPFATESGSGWQEATLASPFALQAGVTYVVSVNQNAFFGLTQFGLQSQITAGPLQSVADGLNGVYGTAAGLFPNKSSKSSNYFIDVVVL